MSTRRFDPLALIFGVIFATLGGLVMSGQLFRLSHLELIWPLVLIAVAVILFAWLVADLSRRPRG